MARSSDDSKCNYWSLQQGEAKEDLVEEDIRDSVRLQKMFRKLQRQVHSPDHQVRSAFTMKRHFPWYCIAFTDIQISYILKFDPFVIRTSRSESLIRAVTSKDFINVPKLTNWQGSFIQLLRSLCRATRACRCFKFSWWENAIDVNFIYSEILHWKDSCWIDISG